MRPGSLQTGKCYFYVNFVANDSFPLQIPAIEAVFFIEEINDGDSPRWLFQFADGRSKDDESRLVVPQEQLHAVHDLDGLLAELTILKDLQLFPSIRGKRLEVVSELSGWPEVQEQLRRGPSEHEHLSFWVEYSAMFVSLWRPNDSNLAIDSQFPRIIGDSARKKFSVALRRFGSTSLNEHSQDWGRSTGVRALMPLNVDLLTLMEDLLLKVWDLEAGDKISSSAERQQSPPE